MATVANHIPAPPPGVYAPAIQRASPTPGVGQGLNVEDLIKNIVLRWSTLQDVDLDQGAWHYRPIPPKRAFAMKIRVHFLGRGVPIPYERGDDSTE